MREEKNEPDDSFGFDGMYGSTLSTASGVFCAPAEALPLGAGGDLSGCDCCGVVCEEEKRELMLLIHDGRRDDRGSSGVALSVLARPNMLGRLLTGDLLGTGGGVGVLGRAGSVFCLGCDNEGGVTCVGAGLLVVSGDCCCWDGGSLGGGTGGLVSLVTETVDEACLRCWFSRRSLARLISSDGLAHSGVGMMVVLLAMRLPLLGVCSQETSTP